MTEDEAKTKICPQKMNLPEGTDKHCLARDCMAWKIKSHFISKWEMSYHLKQGGCSIYNPEGVTHANFK